jgi:hypothetical protein
MIVVERKRDVAASTGECGMVQRATRLCHQNPLLMNGLVSFLSFDRIDHALQRRAMLIYAILLLRFSFCSL